MRNIGTRVSVIVIVERDAFFSLETTTFTVGLKKKSVRTTLELLSSYSVATLEVLRLCIEGAREVLSKVTVVEVKVSALREQLPSGFIDSCLY